MPRFERTNPSVESIVANALSYGQAAAIILTSLTPRNGSPLRSPLSSVLPCVSLSSPCSTLVLVSDSVFIFAYAFTWVPYIRNLMIHSRAASLQQDCASCGTSVDTCAKFCSECGVALTRAPRQVRVGGSSPRRS